MVAKTVFRRDFKEGLTPIRLEQLFDVARRQRPGAQRPLAGKFQPRRAVGFGQAQHTEAGPDALLGVLAGAKQPIDILAFP